MSDKAETIRRGYAAKALLENEDFKLTIKTVNDIAFLQWANTNPEETAVREQNYYLLLATKKLTQVLEALSSSVDFEEKQAVTRNQARPPQEEDDYE
jgi:hypothetical protein